MLNSLGFLFCDEDWKFWVRIARVLRLKNCAGFESLSFRDVFRCAVGRVEYAIISASGLYSFSEESRITLGFGDRWLNVFSIVVWDRIGGWFLWGSGSVAGSPRYQE